MKNLIAIAAPSGSGKTTLCRELQKQNPDLHFSVSSTTRPRRNYEKDGYDYDFISDAEFSRLKDENVFAEFEKVHGYFYGTKKLALEASIQQNQVLLLDVDVMGALSIKRTYPDKTALVFILPPSIEALKDRLRHRGADSEERIKIRLQRLEMELKYKDQFDYVIVNDKLSDAIRALLGIVERVTKGELNGH